MPQLSGVRVSGLPGSVLAAFVAAAAIVLASVAVQTAPAPDRDQASGAPGRTSQDASSGATYVGSDTCLTCHDGMDRGIAATVHGRATRPGTPAARQGCESCHGPGSVHIGDPFDAAGLVKFSQAAPREANEACLSCHTGSTHALWEGSAHDARNLSCQTCHSVHAPKGEALLARATELDLCASCHRTQVTKMARVAHMPVAEGAMTCSTCHNTHGASNVKLLRTGNWINESCVSCHTEKRGPFLFEHAAGRESCSSCHDPHGSSNDRMLVARTPMLCQRCHIGTRHPSTIYDGAAVASQNNRIIGRGCTNCHQAIHGSNHPSGQSLTR